jgi:ubiquinone biosynthesis protein UbiJ
MNSSISQQLMFAQTLSAALETLANQAIAYNLHGTRGLSLLQHKTLIVKLAELGFPLSFSVIDEKVHVSAADEHGDCTLITSINTLYELKSQQQLTELIKQDKLDINGDIKIAQRFADIAQQLDIDWQTEIAKHLGDIPTYKLGQFGKALIKKLTFAKQQIAADATEWLVHEARLAVTKSEISEFNQQVSQVSQQVDHISLRIDHLLNTLSERV